MSNQLSNEGDVITKKKKRLAAEAKPTDTSYSDLKVSKPDYELRKENVADLNELRKEHVALDKLRKKRSAAIRAAAETNAALDAHLECWEQPGFLARFNAVEVPIMREVAAKVLEELEYDLAIDINNIGYIDRQVHSSVNIIERTKARYRRRRR